MISSEKPQILSLLPGETKRKGKINDLMGAWKYLGFCFTLSL